MGDPSSLEESGLSCNKLGVSIPESLGDITTLTRLEVHGNPMLDLDPGNIPANLGDVPNFVLTGECRGIPRPEPPPPPPTPPGPAGAADPLAPANVVGATAAAAATELPGNRLRMERHFGRLREHCDGRRHPGPAARPDLPRRPARGGWPDRAALGAAEQSAGVPDPRAIVNTQYTVPVGVVAAIPLDDRCPEPNLLVRRFDGGDDRIFGYDVALQQWRYVPDIPTFQALGFYWCNVRAVDAGFFERLNPGPSYPVSNIPARAAIPTA